MAYLISETCEELLYDVKRFCEIEVYGKNKDWDKAGELPWETREIFCAQGYQMLTLPEELGGLGLDSIDTAAILEEIAKAEASLAVTLAGSNLALRAVLAGGNETAIERVCEILTAGGLGAFCLTEASAGSDAMSMKTKAVKNEDGSWVITGTKQFITNGGSADFYVVAAIAEETGKPELFLLEKDAEGLQPGVQEDKFGIRCCDTCEVNFNSCIASADAFVGGPEAILAALNEGRALMAAMAAGVAQRAMEEAIAYGKERSQFGRAITDNQSVRFRLADMDTKIEAARQLTAHALHKMDEGLDFSREAAMAKAFAADTAAEAAGSAMELFGGCGYMTGYPAEKLLRDARVFQIIEGTREMQQTLIADALLGKNRG